MLLLLVSLLAISLSLLSELLAFAIFLEASFASIDSLDLSTSKGVTTTDFSESKLSFFKSLSFNFSLVSLTSFLLSITFVLSASSEIFKFKLFESLFDSVLSETAAYRFKKLWSY